MEHNTEKAILQAAERIFIRKGYAETRTTEIAAEAGVTHAMLHYYYRTKEKLFHQIFEEKARILSEVFGNLSQNTEASLPDKIVAFIEAHFEFLRRNPDLPLFVLHEASHNAEHCDLLHRLVLKNLSDKLPLLQEEFDREAQVGRIVPTDVRHLIFTIATLNLGTFIAVPLIRGMYAGLSEEEIYDLRKKEIIQTILCRIKSQEP